MTAIEHDFTVGATEIKAIRLQPALGAESRGIDLTRPLSPALRDLVLQLLLEHQVIFFRDQDITQDQQKALARQFGELGTDSINGADEVQQLRSGTYYGTQWHADATYRETPFFASILRSYVAPPLGGDTVYASAIAAYAGLPDEVKARIDTLTAVHRPLGKAQLLIKNEAQRQAYLEKYPGAEHPVVIRHPHTGAKALYVNPSFTQHIVGLDEAESDALLATLNHQFTRPEYQVRWSWKPHSVAIWDNRAVQHYGVPDYGDQPRYLERVVVQGDRPAR